MKVLRNLTGMKRVIAKVRIVEALIHVGHDAIVRDDDVAYLLLMEITVQVVLLNSCENFGW